MDEVHRLLGATGIQWDVRAKVALGPVGVEAQLTIKDDTSFAAQAATAFRTNRKLVRQEFHSFFRDLSASLDPTKPIVFIVDSIDHYRGTGDSFETVRESVETAFNELAEDLCIPGIHVVYTLPIYVQVPTLGTRQDVVNVKVRLQDGTEFTPGVDALRAVLTKRAPGGDLDRLLGDTGDRLLLASGGLFRDLLRLTTETLLQTRTTLPATDEILSRAEMTVREDYLTTMTQEQVSLVKQVHQSRELFAARDEGADGAALISSGAILRYPNDTQTWYAVHPLLHTLLD